MTPFRYREMGCLVEQPYSFFFFFVFLVFNSIRFVLIFHARSHLFLCRIVGLFRYPASTALRSALPRSRPHASQNGRRIASHFPVNSRLPLSTCPVTLTSRLLAIRFLSCPVNRPSSSVRFPANQKQTSDPSFLVMGC